MNLFKDFNKNINKYHMKTMKTQLNEIMKPIKEMETELNTEIKLLKKSQTEINLKMKSSRSQT